MNEEFARLPGIGSEAAPEEVRETFASYVKARGKVPNLFRVAAHAPTVAAALAAHQAAVMGPGTVPVLLKELLSVRVSHINLCDY